jgi:glucose-1-phosphate adenylyltransferase
MSNTLIILAAGASSRMRESFKDATEFDPNNSNVDLTSKALIKLGKANRPMLDYLLLNAKKAGYEDIYLVVGETATDFKKHYSNNSIFNDINIFFATQYIPKDRSKPFGTADAVWQALEQFPELQKRVFSVCNADNLYSEEALKALRLSKFPQAFISYNREGLQFSAARISAFALVLLDNEHFLSHIVEKPNPIEIESFRQQDGSFRVSMNLWKLDGPKIFPFLKTCPINVERNEKELPTAILNMTKEYPKSIQAIPFNEHVPDLTSKEDIDVLKKYVDSHFNQ